MAKQYVYLSPEEWGPVEQALLKIFPNYGMGEIAGLMCAYGYTSDWRKSLKTWLVQTFRGAVRYRDMLLVSREIDAPDEAAAMDKLYQQGVLPPGTWSKDHFPRLGKGEAEAGITHYTHYPLGWAADDENAEKSCIYITITPKSQ